MYECCKLFFFSLRHFGHLPHSCIKTRRNSVHYSIFSVILTEMTYFFFLIISKTFRSMTEKKQVANRKSNQRKI